MPAPAGLEGGLQTSRGRLEGSFEAPASRPHLRMRSRGGSTVSRAVMRKAPILRSRPFSRSSPKNRQVFIESKKSPLLLVWRSLSMRNSIASVTPIGLRMRRST
ncbi:hypothetical protein FV229_20425 [Methylobacterium sp. WL120]|nr:hypothetical protein FV229_20425 [Methylobacterium sp. WL120]